MSTTLRSSALGVVALAAALTLLAATLLAQSPASAHAVLLEAAPADGASLETPPERIVLTFDGPVDVSDRAMVLTTAGQEQDLAAGAGPTADQLTATVPADLQPGTHTLAWRAISDDGHAVEGALSFTTAAATATDATPAVGDEAEETAAGDGAGEQGGPGQLEATATGSSADEPGGTSPLLIALGVLAVAGLAAAVLVLGKRPDRDAPTA